MNHIINWNVEFISINENIDIKSKEGEIFLNAFGIFAEYERKRISERTKEGLKVRKKLDKPLGRPKGRKDNYKRNNDNYLLKEKKKRIIKKFNDLMEVESEILNNKELSVLELIADRLSITNI